MEPNAISEKRSFRPAEVAQRNGISERTVYSLIAAGALQAVKLGRATLITVEAETAWLESLPARNGKVA
ncbi:helix-turn-helix domain-containing protein [Ancylobacter pratisalsi]|uniref:Helix-turn-helix domain-containing protein n=1 Tax=Ancylobacter pratisalsi TaxID=1745854 RepID=A0A6P1YSZ0_9HYPH|nr:helix-turn-helix domain-containing protein [Ancylobacter pratisalsi]QIB35816.1 helix-turn-helix domain-containing protein [Ancylobacter pratisalsi]